MLSSAGGPGSSAADAGCSPGHGSHGGAPPSSPPRPLPPPPASEAGSAPVAEAPDLAAESRRARNRDAARRSRAKRKGAAGAKEEQALGLPGGDAIVAAADAVASRAADAAVVKWEASPASPDKVADGGGGTGETKGARLVRKEAAVTAAKLAVKLLRNQRSAHKAKVYRSTYERELNAALGREQGPAELPVGSGASVQLGGDDPPLEARRPSCLGPPAESRSGGKSWRSSTSAEPPARAPLAGLPAGGASSVMDVPTSAGVVPGVIPPLDALHASDWFRPLPGDLPVPDDSDGLPSCLLQEAGFRSIRDGAELLHPLPTPLRESSSAGGEAASGVASSPAAAVIPGLLEGGSNNGSPSGEDGRPTVVPVRKRSPSRSSAGGSGLHFTDPFPEPGDGFLESTEAAEAG